MRYYLVASKRDVKVKVEKEDKIPNLEVLFTYDNLKDADLDCKYNMQYYIDLGYRHIKVVNAKGYEYRYYYTYAWLPKGRAIKLNPAPKSVPHLAGAGSAAPGVHYRPKIHRLIKRYQ